MQNSRLKRYARVVLSTATVVIPTSVMIVANAQPPQPRPEALAEPPALDSLDPDEMESEQSEGLEYLTRAPLHEAFAGPYDADPTPNPIVTKQPPEPIDELPPEYRPSGDEVTWIPGYWFWDDERTDFIWISGVWRDIPPQQRWIPGYWASVPDGFQYVSGFWAGDQLEEVAYLPEPPESLEQGSASPSPGDDYFYVPGNWVYQSNDYQWQPGFWSQVQQDWVWVPSQYVWTPNGCIYQNGYWDYDVAHRGVVFTPVYFQQPVYQQPQYTYRPQYTVDTGLALFVHLFVRPNQRQYYYGDYYGSSYSNTYYPWSTRYQNSRYYDPFFASYSHRSYDGGNNNYISWINSQHQLFAGNQQYRPARTIAAQRDFLRTNRGTAIDPSLLRLTSIGESLNYLVRSNGGQNGFQRLSDNERGRFRDEIAPQRQLGRDRLTMETVDKRGQDRAEKNAKRGDSPDEASKLAAGAEANAERDKDKKPNPDAGVNGRDRLRLPEVDRRAGAREGDVAGNRPGNDRGRGDRPNAVKPPAEPNGDTVTPSAREDRGRMRDRLDRAAAGADSAVAEAERAIAGRDRNRRAGAERLRPETPGDWPAATPRQSGRGTPGRPDGAGRGRTNAPDGPASGNPQSAQPDGKSRSEAAAGPSVDRAQGPISRAMNNRQPSVGGGEPARNPAGKAERGGRSSRGNGAASPPAASAGKGGGGGKKSSEKPAKQPKAKKSKDK